MIIFDTAGPEPGANRQQIPGLGSFGASAPYIDCFSFEEIEDGGRRVVWPENAD